MMNNGMLSRAIAVSICLVGIGRHGLAKCVLQDSATLRPSDHSPTTKPGFSHLGWYNYRG